MTTVMLIPGMLNDPSLWDDVRALIDPGIRVEVLDVLPHEDITDMARAGWQQLAGLADDPALVIVGFSMGGYVAQEMLATAPRAVSGLMLCATSALPESPDSLTGRQTAIAAMRADFPRVVEGILRRSFAVPTEAHTTRMRRMMLDIGAEQAVSQLQAIARRRDHRQTLIERGVPLSVLCGLEDRVTPPDLSRATAALVPGTPLQLLPQSGHMLPLEQAPALVQALMALCPH